MALPSALSSSIVETAFDRQMRIPWWNQERLASSRVMVVGAGALGNEVIKNLALVGVGNLLIVDFDIIEDANLSRSVLFRQDDLGGGRKAEVAALRAQQLNPNPKAMVNAFHGDLVWELGAGVYRHVDLVIGCLDNIEARRTVNERCWQAGIPWIDGGMYELSGSVAVYDADPNQACYECGMDEDAYRRARQRYSCSGYAVRANIRQGREPTTQTTSAIIAALQSQEAIKILHGLDTFGGHKLVYQGYPQNFQLPEPSAFMLVELGLNPDCLCHGEEKYTGGIVELSWATSAQTSARDLLMWATDEMGLEGAVLHLGRTYALEAICAVCGAHTLFDKPAFQLKDDELVCPQCQNTCPRCQVISQGVSTCPNCGQTDLNERSLQGASDLNLAEQAYAALLDRPLRELGIPALHILRLSGAQGAGMFVELTGDLPFVFRAPPS